MKSFKELLGMSESKVNVFVKDDVIVFPNVEETEKAAEFLTSKGMNGLKNQDYSTKKLIFTDNETAKTAMEMLDKNKNVNEADNKAEEKKPEDKKESEENEPKEKDEGSKEKDEDTGEIDSELKEIIKDMTPEEKEILLAHAYGLIFAGVSEEDFLKDEDEEKDEDDKDTLGGDIETNESMITHLTSAERTQGKILRRTPKWKRKAKIRYIKNKKCPPGTTWSSKEKSCTHLNIDLSRLQKMISKMKIKG